MNLNVWFNGLADTIELSPLHTIVLQDKLRFGVTDAQCRPLP
jgi:hypothetical protein